LEEYHGGAFSAIHSSLLAPFSYVAWLYTADTEKKCSDGGNTSCCMLLVGIVMA
jgi:hypothetical protein